MRARRAFGASPHPATGRRVAASVGVVLVVVLLVALFGFALPATSPWEASVVEGVARLRTPGLTAVMRVASDLGSVAALSVIAVAVGLTGSRRRIPGAWCPAVALAGSVGSYSAIKALVGRDRPVEGLVVAAGEAFPSGHATQAAAVLVTCALVVGHRRRLAVGAAVVLVLVVGFSRVYLGVHWPWDVVGGWTLGAGWALSAAVWLRRPTPVPGDVTTRRARSPGSG